MPLLPIDLQTLFSQSQQVGREQAVQQQAPPQAQAQAASELVREAVVRDTQVNEAHDTGRGPEAVKDRAQGRRQRHRGGRKAVAHKKPVFTDPDLGKRIDITG